MTDLSRLFPTHPRVIERKDDFGNPVAFDVVTTVPETQFSPEHDRIVCFLPDDMTDEFRDTANLIAAVPDLLECLEDHCLYCSDCDFDNSPDQTCKFGRALKRARGEGSYK